jgi:K+-sensing histidine kinase KdpD
LKLSRLNSKWWPLLAGPLVCSLAAALVAILFSPQPSRSIIPFAFLSVVVVLAMRFGAAVGIAGSFLAAIIFAYRLYPPLHSVQVQSQVARSNLAWMILAGVVLSFLLAPPSRTTQPRK